MKLKYTFHYQPIGNKIVATAIGKDARRFSGMVQLNETGCFIMRLFERETTREEALERLKEQYECDEATLAKALDDTMALLQSDGVL